MISYELAKKMKDAGFPQEHSDTYALPDGRFLGGDTIELYEMEVACKVPCLEEVIEACGEGAGKQYNAGIKDIEVVGLLSNQALKKEYRWMAYTGLCCHATDVSAYGETPLEAVCNLWLELNKIICTKK